MGGGFGKGPPVVDNVPVIGARDIQNGMVPCPGGHFRIGIPAREYRVVLKTAILTGGKIGQACNQKDQKQTEKAQPTKHISILRLMEPQK